MAGWTPSARSRICSPDLARDEDKAYFLPHNFLGNTYHSGIEMHDGDACGDEQSARFRVRHRRCERFEPGTPFHNPYGVWFLEPIDEDDEDEEEDEDRGGTSNPRK